VSTPPHLLSVALTRGHFELDLEISWQERVSVFFGPSGAGKSTLFEALLGLHPTARARVCIGGEWLEDSETGLRRPTWQRGLGWVPQDPTLFPHLDVEANLRFAGPDAQTLERAVEVLELRPLLTRDVRDLSGGERNRVHLAKVLKSGANLLLLDEPTNDLDVDTLRALESGLESYPGCAAIISHDRWFLDRVATHVLAFEGDSQVRWFEGNFSEYEAVRKKELGADAQPHRVRYKPLVRG